MTAKRTLSIGLVLAAGLAILPAVTVTAQDRQDRRMDVINDTDRVVNNFYATNSSIKNWGRDLLGKDVIDPKQSYRFDFNDGTGRCVFDLRAVLDNGRVFERYRVNVCTASSWRLYGQGTDDSRPTTPSARRGRNRQRKRGSRRHQAKRGKYDACDRRLIAARQGPARGALQLPRWTRDTLAGKRTPERLS